MERHEDVHENGTPQIPGSQRGVQDPHLRLLSELRVTRHDT